MKPLKDGEKDALRYLLFFIFVTVSVTVYQGKLRLLFAPDPPVESFYQCSFNAEQLSHDDRISECAGFVAGGQGLELPPGSSGRLAFQFEKQGNQGCLLRVWFYGDTGDKRPNAIKIYPEGGTAFQLAGSGNHIGSVFDISERLQGCSSFKISFEAENRGPFQARVLDAVELVTGQHAQVKPSLPDLPAFLGLICIAYVGMVSLFTKRLSNKEKIVQILLFCILLLALYLRWNEIEKISGTMLDEDAKGYYGYAQKMQLTGDQGFYSAHFEKREPLFILIVKLFFALFGVSATHLRFASCAFSLSVVYLTYRLGKEWFSGAVGLIAAFILAVHPYLIMLSARGLREEWFCMLLLLFVYYSYLTLFRSAWARVTVSGLIAGCIVLTRSEFFPVLVMVLFLYPLLAGRRWNYAMAAAALVLCIVIWVPHQYSIYKKYGDFFYTANQYARFYANREFAGQPGFPSEEDIMLKGMYYGPKITPVDYYCTYHTTRQLVCGSIIGFARIHLQMPFAFVSGRGNAKTVIHEAGTIKNNPGAKAMMNMIRLAARLFRDRWLSNLMGLAVFLTFIAGLMLMGILRHWVLYVYLITFQAHTSFLAFLGLDERLTVHSYPLIALCCGFCVCSLFVKRGDQNRSARMLMKNTS